MFIGLLMYGVYSSIMIIVLLNMLIAMMSNSYQCIAVCREKSDENFLFSIENLILQNSTDAEWKFARQRKGLPSRIHFFETAFQSQTLDQLFRRWWHPSTSVQYCTQSQVHLLCLPISVSPSIWLFENTFTESLAKHQSKLSRRNEACREESFMCSRKF